MPQHWTEVSLIIHSFTIIKEQTTAFLFSKQLQPPTSYAIGLLYLDKTNVLMKTIPSIILSRFMI